MSVPTRSAGCSAWYLVRLLAAWLAFLLGACATPPPESPVVAATLLHDGLFQASIAPTEAAEVFALTDAMRQFADEQITAVRWRRDARRALMDALVARGQLRLEYDDGRTRTAAEAFDSRAGNCLSLVIMTSAFAKYLDIPVRYQSVQVREQFTRDNDLTLASGHINVVLSRLPASFAREQILADELTIDFVPPESLRGMNVRILSEATVLAMFMNNRAVETMAAGQLDTAYAWARQALHLDPKYLPGINTLGVIYLRAGHLRQAEAALRHVVARDAEDAAALGNLVITLRQDKRPQEADLVAARLAQVQPYPPFHFLDLGRQAFEKGDLDKARELIGRELRRQPYQHEAHFWAAVVDANLGNQRDAESHMRQAIEHSGTPQLQTRYSAKLAALLDAATR
jgi:Tfp pilus assembly protein PilF